MSWQLLKCSTISCFKLSRLTAAVCLADRVAYWLWPCSHWLMELWPFSDWLMELWAYSDWLMELWPYSDWLSLASDSLLSGDI